MKETKPESLLTSVAALMGDGLERSTAFAFGTPFERSAKWLNDAVYAAFGVVAFYSGKFDLEHSPREEILANMNRLYSLPGKVFGLPRSICGSVQQLVATPLRRWKPKKGLGQLSIRALRDLQHRLYGLRAPR